MNWGVMVVCIKELLARAKEGDIQAQTEIIGMYKPLLLKESIVNGVFDDDLYQELWLLLMSCIRTIKI
jgi:hypothetical protein